MNGWERLSWSRGARRQPGGSLDVIWDTKSLVQKMIVGFSSNVNQATLSSTRSVNRVWVFSQEVRRWGAGIPWLLSQSFWLEGSCWCGWGPIPIGLRGPRTHKSSLSITEQNITAQTPNPPKTETLVGLLGLSALGKDDHVLEAMSMFPAVPSLPEL